MSNILFNTEMVRAILNGDKTQTRRVVKPQPLYGVGSCHYCNSGFAHLNKLGSCECRPIKCPYGGVGDEIWVRETWAAERHYDHLKPSAIPAEHAGIFYLVHKYGEDAFIGKTRPSIFMPRWASRLTLTVTAVRVEQLHDITEADAVQEGIDRIAIHGDYTARFNFQLLWETINAKRGYGWDKNPWVWVIEFEVTEANHE